MKKQLGGDRLGSGNKLNVELRNYERSSHDLSQIFRSTMSAGTLVPFMTAVALPGDTFDIDLNCDVKTHPTLGPLFGTFKVQLDVFLCPIRLYNSMLHNNMLGIGLNMAAVKFPLMNLKATPLGEVTEGNNIDNTQINPSCLLSYLGIRGVGQTNDADTKTRDFNAIPVLAYYDIYKNYYANKQEEIGAVIHTDVSAVPEHVTDITIGTVTIDGTTNVTLVTGEIISVHNDSTYQDADTIIVIINGADMLLSAISTLVDGTGVTQTYSINAAYNGAIISNWKYVSATNKPPIVPRLRTFPLSNIDDMRNNILQATQSAPYFITGVTLSPYQFLFQSSGGMNAMMQTQEGLAIKTYQSDLLNNWIQTDWIDGSDGIEAITSVDTSSGEFTITHYQT